MQEQDLIGEQFGSYRLIRLLGEGGQASVYLGQHVRLANMQTAVKVARTYLSSEGYAKFEEEAETIAGLIHPRIVRLLEFDLKDGRPFLVMDYAPQGSLRKRHPKGTQLSLQQAVHYIEQVAQALQYAHDCKVIHRDVKPENLLIGRQGEILLGDFGIATIAHTTASLYLQNVAGTLRYMAPEQFEQRPRPASDQYSLGIVAYEWLAGEPPFTGTLGEFVARQSMGLPPPPLRARPNVNIPPATEDVIMRALVREPSQRFHTVRAFAQALKDTLLDRDTGPTDPLPPLRSQRIERYSPLSLPSKPKLSETQQSSPAMAGPQETVLPRLFAETAPPIDAIPPVQNDPGDKTPPMQGERDTHLASTPSPSTKKRRSKPWLIVGLALLLIGCILGLTTFRVWGQTGSPAGATATSTAQVSPFPTPEGWLFAYHPERSHPSVQRPLTKDAILQLKQTWVFGTGGSISSSPVRDGETVYVGSDDKRLYAINVQDGKERWSFLADSEIYTPPVVVGETVYFGTSSGLLYAVNINNQQMVWPPFTTGGIIVCFPAVADGTVYVGSADHNLYAIDAQSGALLGTFPTGGAIRSSPAVVNGTVYIGSFDHKLYAIDAKNMQQRWSFSAQDEIQSSPVVANGVVYVGSEDDRLYAIDAQNGHERWEFLTKGHVSSSPIVVGDTVYVGGEDGSIYAINTRDGSQRWSYQTGGPLYSSPVVVEGVVYIGSQDHKFYAIDAQTGKLLKAFQTGDEIHSSPAVVDGSIYVSSWDSKLYAFSI